jgi:hypothetical protein
LLNNQKELKQQKQQLSVLEVKVMNVLNQYFSNSIFSVKDYLDKDPIEKPAATNLLENLSKKNVGLTTSTIAQGKGRSYTTKTYKYVPK